MKGDRAASEGAAAMRERDGLGAGTYFFLKDGRDGQSAPTYERTTASA